MRRPGCPRPVTCLFIPRGFWRDHRGIVTASVVMEGDMKNVNWNGILQALVLVRFGQELGSDSRLARALHELVEAVLTAVR